MLRSVHEIFARKPGGHHPPEAPKAALFASFTATLEPGLVVGEDLDNVLRLYHAEPNMSIASTICEVF